MSRHAKQPGIPKRPPAPGKSSKICSNSGCCVARRDVLDCGPWSQRLVPKGKTMTHNVESLEFATAVEAIRCAAANRPVAIQLDGKNLLIRRQDCRPLGRCRG